MNWTDPTAREARLAAALEWERREIAPLEDIARSRDEAARTGLAADAPRAQELPRARSPRGLALVRSLMAGSWR